MVTLLKVRYVYSIKKMYLPHSGTNSFVNCLVGKEHENFIVLCTYDKLFESFEYLDSFHTEAYLTPGL